MYEDIKEIFKKIIRESQGIPEPQIDDLFDEWLKAKEKFIRRFGGLVYEWPEPVEFTLDDEVKARRVMEFAQMVQDNFNNCDLAEFIDDNAAGFFENKITNAGKYNIPKDMRLIRAFKFFEKDPNRLRAIQDYASTYIQENKIKGTLCLSVHPIDFLTSSENSYNWRSCHSLDGEYRAGNLSYMVDEVTFMAYLKGASGEFYTYGGVEWNSKKWRMLIHERPDSKIMFAGRQYPFSSKPGIDIVLNIYNNLVMADTARDTMWGRNHDKFGVWRQDYIDKYTVPGLEEPLYLDERYFVYANELVGMNEIVEEASCSLNYNDILRSTCYKYPYYAVLNEHHYNTAYKLKQHKLVIGKAVKCLHCNGNMIYNPETMRCDDCELMYGFENNDIYGTCDCCGRRIYYDESVCVGDDNVCYDCYDTECFTCDCCGEVYYNTDRNFASHNSEWYCPYCYKDYLQELE